MTTDEMSRVVELAPCPFCGGEAELLINGTSGYKLAYVRCTECKAQSDTIVRLMHGDRDPEADAIAAWNTRTPAGWQDIASALLKAAGITEAVTVVNHVEHERGAEMWSEVLSACRPHNKQVAHCADEEDAELIAFLINAVVPAPPAKENNA